MESPEFLRACLEAAIDERELIDDILEACALSGVHAGGLAVLSPEEAAERLYLTEGEAAALLNVCKQAVADGVPPAAGRCCVGYSCTRTCTCGELRQAPT